MPRRSRALSDSGWYHVMNRGVDRCEIFLGDHDRVDFGHAIAEAHARSGVEVHGYCLMPNHFHLLIRTGVDGPASFMHQLGTTYVRHFNDRHGRDGHLFRGRYRSVTIEADGQLLQTLRYVHRNPLALVTLDDLEWYRWSSHRTYLGARARPAWLTVDTLRAGFVDVDDYRAFVLAPELDPLMAADWFGHLVDLVATECDLDGRSSTGLARLVALAVIDRHPDTLGGALDGLLPANGEACRAARYRARRRLAVEPRARGLVDAVERQLFGAPPATTPP